MIIGKYALESITTGMYINPLDVLREYIQNSSDAIDEAIGLGNLSASDAKIIITIDPLDRKVVIEDNGSGIPKKRALQILTDIGNSQKQYYQNRGFRGIGRLSGLSYCDKLTFKTTCLGETSGSEVKYDAQHLRSLLALKEDDRQTAESAVNAICTVNSFSTSESTHYFMVILEGVSPDSGLLNDKLVLEYLSQVAPVSFDHESFSWGSVISQEIDISTYPIFVRTASGTKEIFKNYSDTFVVNKTTGEIDQIHDITFTALIGNEGEKLGTAWYGISNFKGSIAERAIKGLRIRVGNILVGDSQSLNHVFKDSRFNGWVVGEIYIDNPELVPNARRDDFEHNIVYYRLEELLKGIAVDITQKIRSASVSRNKGLDIVLKKVEQVETTIDSELKNATISAAAKGKLTIKVNDVRKELTALQVRANEENLRNEAIEKLDILTGRVKGSTQFRAINMIEGITFSEKEMLARIFRNLVLNNSKEEAQRCIDMILKTYEPEN